MSSDAEFELHKKIIQSNHKFAINLYKVLAANENENTFFSPLSIYIALVLAYIGAKGDTAAELMKHLHLPEKKEDLLNGVRYLLDELKNPKLNTATEMFLEKTYKVKSSYKEAAKKYLSSESQLMNFKDAWEEAAKSINAWVLSKTNNKIDNLIPPGTLDGSTRLILVNAIHFKDQWLSKFKEHDTYKQPFFTSKDNSVDVDMMHKTDRFGYVEKDSFKALQLPYEDTNFSMVILLPNEIDGLSAFEEKVYDMDLSSLLEDMDTVKVNVALPKFKLETSINLNDALKKLGVQTMFSEEKADFSEIHEPTERGLVVSKVLHKAFVEVNEEGTEAAAATAVIACCYSSLIEIEDEVFEFIADHPFFFCLYHRETMLFVGKIICRPN